jgi:hypothetical protein
MAVLADNLKREHPSQILFNGFRGRDLIVKVKIG